MIRNLFYLLLLLAISCTSEQDQNQMSTARQVKSESISISNEALIERGKYLVTLMDCNTCHTPMKMSDQGPTPDMTKLLSGFPETRPLPDFSSEIIRQGILFYQPDLTSTAGPWGISFAANLTPHETGIGNWTFDQFSRAIRQGKHKGLENGRPLLPPMPWQSYQGIEEEDLRSIFTYLLSVPPIENKVPTHIPPTGTN